MDFEDLHRTLLAMPQAGKEHVMRPAGMPSHRMGDLDDER